MNLLCHQQRCWSICDSPKTFFFSFFFSSALRIILKQTCLFLFFFCLFLSLFSTKAATGPVSPASTESTATRPARVTIKFAIPCLVHAIFVRKYFFLLMRPHHLCPSSETVARRDPCLDMLIHLERQKNNYCVYRKNFVTF